MAGADSSSPGTPGKGMRLLNGYSIVYVTSGEAFYEDTLGHKRNLHKCDFFITYPDIGHRYGAKEGKHWGEIFILFKGPLFNLWRQQGVINPEKPFMHLEPVEYWSKRFKDVAWLHPEATHEQSLVRLCLLQQTLADAFLDTQKQKLNIRDIALLTQAKDLIEASIYETPNFELIAERLGMSYEAFRKRFKKETSLSPGQYFQQARIRKASDLLIHSKLSTRSIAEKLNFYDEFHFSKQFKKALGFTPRVFRNNFRGAHRSKH